MEVTPNCYIGDDGHTVLIRDRERLQYIFRHIDEQREFTISDDTLYGELLEMRDLTPRISFGDERDEVIFEEHEGSSRLNAMAHDLQKYYPYFISLHPSGLRVYNVHSGETKIFNNHFRPGKGGKLALEANYSITVFFPGLRPFATNPFVFPASAHSKEDNKTIKVVRFPFDPVKRQVILEMKTSDIDQLFFNKNLDRLHIQTHADTNIYIDVETGEIKEFIWGLGTLHTPRPLNNTMYLSHYPDYSLHKIDNICVSPMKTFSGNREDQLKKFIGSKDFMSSDALSLLTGILKEESLVEEHADSVQLFYNIFFTGLPTFIWP